MTQAAFNVTSADGSAAMLAKAFENGETRGPILKTVQAHSRSRNRHIHGKYEAIICVGNSFTRLHEESDRRRALAAFCGALPPDGIPILDQRNADYMPDQGFKSKQGSDERADRSTPRVARWGGGLREPGDGGASSADLDTIVPGLERGVKAADVGPRARGGVRRLRKREQGGIGAARDEPMRKGES